MLATALLSMWLSNTATAMMMLPMALSMTRLLNEQAQYGDDDPARAEKADHFGTAVLLGVAYSASIGGLGTLIGTPPSIIECTVHVAGVSEKRAAGARWVKRPSGVS